MILVIVALLFPIIVAPIMPASLFIKKFWNKKYALAWGSIFSILGYCFFPKNVVDFTRYTNTLPYYGSNTLSYIFQHDNERLYLRDIIFHVVGKTGDNQLLTFLIGLIVYSIVFYVLLDVLSRHKQFYTIRFGRVFLLTNFVINIVSPFYILNNVRNITAFVIVGFAVYRDLVEKKKNIITYSLYIVPVFLHLSAAVLILLRFLIPLVHKNARKLVIATFTISIIIRGIHELFIRLPFRIPLLYEVVIKAYNTLLLNNFQNNQIELSDNINFFIGIIIIVVVLISFFYRYSTKKRKSISFGDYEEITDYMYLIALVAVVSIFMGQGSFMRFKAYIVLFFPLFYFPFITTTGINKSIKLIIISLLYISIPIFLLDIILYFRFVDVSRLLERALQCSPIVLLFKLLFTI